MNGPKIFFEIPIFGGLPINQTMVSSWLVMGTIILLAYLGTRKLEKIPSKPQLIAEGYVGAVYGLVEQTMGKDKLGFAPYIGTLFAFSLFSSLSSLVGLRPPTADLNTTLGWALITFFLVQANGIRKKGIAGYLKGFLEPLPLLLPLNIISEVANPISLSFRHFGNIAGGMVITMLLYNFLAWLSSLVLGFLRFIDAIPLLQIGIPAVLSIYFDLFTSVLQAFIFSMLTMVFVAMAMD